MNTDGQLKEALVAQLNFWVGCSASNIQVAVKDGIVTLRGGVPNNAEKRGCIGVAQRIAGVKAVVDEVVVEAPKTRRCTDAEITAAALDAIRRIATAPANPIQVIVINGRLLLEGTVEHWFQKEIVEDAVRDLEGVFAVTNLITIKPQPLQPDLKDEIKAAFAHHALMDARNIDAKFEGTRVILHGSIPNIAEREEAELVARAAKGVTNVENHIEITT